LTILDLLECQIALWVKFRNFANCVSYYRGLLVAYRYVQVGSSQKGRGPTPPNPNLSKDRLISLSFQFLNLPHPHRILIYCRLRLDCHALAYIPCLFQNLVKAPKLN